MRKPDPRESDDHGPPSASDGVCDCGHLVHAGDAQLVAVRPWESNLATWSVCDHAVIDCGREYARGHVVDVPHRSCGEALDRESIHRAIKSGELAAKRTSRPKEAGELPRGKTLILARSLRLGSSGCQKIGGATATRSGDYVPRVLTID